MRDPAIFDGHNDLLSELWRAGGDPAKRFAEGLPGHIDRARAEAGGFGGGFFAVWIPSPVDLTDLTERMSQPQYDLPMPPPIPQDAALPAAFGQIAVLHRLEAAGHLSVCTSVDQIENCRREGRMAAILHFEGAEAIDGNLEALEVFHRAGLRSLGPVWSRNTRFAEGVPFRFPASPDIGGGLTEDGVRLVKACNQMGIMLDVSHLNAAGFWDLARVSDAPIVATHSNAHAISRHARNLTDDQLRAIADSDGMVGLNFATAFLRPDGQMVTDVPFELMMRHLDHLMGILGEDRVGFGSDFDGAIVPAGIKDLAGLPNLRQAMRDHGYDDALIEKLCWGNWMAVLRRVWKN
ncbi:MAG: dipeptidase [Pseudomonadota bacterium]